jgi:hypothetical protein
MGTSLRRKVTLTFRNRQEQLLTLPSSFGSSFLCHTTEKNPPVSTTGGTLLSQFAVVALRWYRLVGGAVDRETTWIYCPFISLGCGGGGRGSLYQVTEIFRLR